MDGEEKERKLRSFRKCKLLAKTPKMFASCVPPGTPLIDNISNEANGARISHKHLAKRTN